MLRCRARGARGFGTANPASPPPPGPCSTGERGAGGNAAHLPRARRMRMERQRGADRHPRQGWTRDEGLPDGFTALRPLPQPTSSAALRRKLALYTDAARAALCKENAPLHLAARRGVRSSVPRHAASVGFPPPSGGLAQRSAPPRGGAAVSSVAARSGRQRQGAATRDGRAAPTEPRGRARSDRQKRWTLRSCGNGHSQLGWAPWQPILRCSAHWPRSRWRWLPTCAPMCGCEQHGTQ